jgi:hypothetical protein
LNSLAKNDVCRTSTCFKEKTEVSFVERKTVYFDSAGRHNTAVVLKLAKKYAETEGIKDIVVASTTGETGAKASQMFKGFNLVVVTHHVGFRKPGEHELRKEFRHQILENGAKILTSTHALSSVERAVRKRFGTLQPLELIANALRLLGEGTKVCVEIVVMAADAGLIPVDRDVIAIAGTGRGADTALVIKPANASAFFGLKIRETIAKPRNFH